MGVRRVVGGFYPVVTCLGRAGPRCVETMGLGEVAILDEGICGRLVAGWFGRDPGV